MLITEKQLRELIREVIISENLQNEELLEEGIKDALRKALFGLGLSATMINPIVKHAKASGFNPGNAKSIEILANSFADEVPETCPNYRDSWWDIHGNEGSPENIEDISIVSRDYLRDTRGKGNFIGNDVAISVKLQFGYDMRKHSLIMGIARIFNDPSKITNDMKNINDKFNQNRSRYLKTDESDPEGRLSQLKAWEYVKEKLREAGERAINSGNEDEYEIARRKLFTLLDNANPGDKEYDNKQYGSAQAKINATRGDLR